MVIKLAAANCPVLSSKFLGDARHDVEFLCLSLYLAGIFHDFSCQLYLPAQEDKLLVEDLTSAPTCVICGADTRSANAVGNHGGDRAIFHAATEEIVVNAEDILAWRGANVSGVGNCVWFA
jgi:hypothetical protein